MDRQEHSNSSFNRKWSFFSFLTQEDSLCSIQHHRSAVICATDTKKEKKRKIISLSIYKRRTKFFHMIMTSVFGNHPVCA